jgi:hypothetical protein
VRRRLAGVLHFRRHVLEGGSAVEEKEIIEKRTVRRAEPVDKVTNVNVGPDGTTNIQESGGTVIEEEHVVEEHRHP